MVPCPDCGQVVNSRGLSGHRRLRHNLAPAPPLPSSREPAEPLVMEALTRIQGAIDRIEGRLELAAAQALRAESPREEETRLRTELTALLERISRVERTRRSLVARAEDASARREAAQSQAALSRLRLEQTRLVCRMDELHRGVPREESLWS